MLALLAGCSASTPEPTVGSVTSAQVVERYARQVHESYRKSLAGALKLQSAVEALVVEPTEPNLAAARAAWVAAREPYSRTEVFRFYEGPIDAPRTGSEGRLNAWPLNEAYIDYVEGDLMAGIIQQGQIPITAYELSKRNAAEDEADVTTGYHAVEFLLWGQDLNPDGPGRRPLSDYIGDSPVVQRRREYLRVVTVMIIEDLQSLVEAWRPDAKDENYRARFIKLDEKEALGKILTGLATLTGFELASERIGVPLDSASQEDEQSCFSDNTHRDFLANMAGVKDVYEGVELAALIGTVSPELKGRLDVNLRQTMEVLDEVAPPIDRILSSSAGSESRKRLERVITLLQEQSRLWVEAGKALGVEVTVAAE